MRYASLFEYGAYAAMGLGVVLSSPWHVVAGVGFLILSLIPNCAPSQQARDYILSNIWRSSRKAKQARP